MKNAWFHFSLSYDREILLKELWTQSKNSVIFVIKMTFLLYNVQAWYHHLHTWQLPHHNGFLPLISSAAFAKYVMEVWGGEEKKRSLETNFSMEFDKTRTDDEDRGRRSRQSSVYKENVFGSSAIVSCYFTSIIFLGTSLTSILKRRNKHLFTEDLTYRVKSSADQ